MTPATTNYDTRDVQHCKGRARDEHDAVELVHRLAARRGWEVFTIYTSRAMDGTVEYTALFRIPHEQG